MKTTSCKNNEVVQLVREGFTADGYVVTKGHAKRKAAAKVILSDEDLTRSIYGTLIDGYDTIASLQILSNPKMIL